MAGTFDPARIAKTESLFREVNERIAESADRFDAVDAAFVCECGDSGCTERVETTLEEYEDVRANAARFIVASGHEDERVESVVRREEDYSVVTKDHPDVEGLVRELDPRGKTD